MEPGAVHYLLGGTVNYSAVETEAIGLCIALEAVDSIANHALLEIRHVEQYPGEAEAWFPSRVHQQLFLIRTLDFANESGAQKLTGVAGSCVNVLEAACESRRFDIDGSSATLCSATTALREWLDAITPLKLWLGSLDLEATIAVSRAEFLHIAGNQSKHNLSRLTGVSTRVSDALRQAGHEVPPEQVPLALDDFREHLQEDYFIYYGTWLAELLNNVRWGLQEYLFPTFERSYTRDPDHEHRYSYIYPDGVASDIPRQWFWRLMNNIRSGPPLKRFAGAHYLKRTPFTERSATARAAQQGVEPDVE